MAKLETLANSPALPQSRVLVTVQLPDNASITTIDLKALPLGWAGWPYLDELADITEHWISTKQYWIMRVPSAQATTEFNYLLNPLHSEHTTLQLMSIEPHPFDARLK